MKKIIISLIIGLILLVLGAAISISALALHKKSNASSANSVDTLTCYNFTGTSTEIDTLNFSVLSSNVTFEIGTSDVFEIEYWDYTNNPIYTIEENEKTLSINNTPEDNNVNLILDNMTIVNFSLDSIHINSSNLEYHPWKVKVPQEFAGRFNLKNISGNYDLDGMTASEFSILTTSGDISLKNCVSNGSFTLSSTSGDISCKEISSADHVSMESASGNVTINNSDLSDRTVSLKTTSGDCSGTKLICSGLDIITTSGEVSMDHITVPDSLTADAVSGDISIGLTNALNDYSIHCTTVSGDTNLPSAQNGTGKGNLGISTVSGNVDVSFEVEKNQ